MTAYAFEHDTDNLPTTVATALSPVVFRKFINQSITLQFGSAA